MKQLSSIQLQKVFFQDRTQKNIWGTNQQLLFTNEIYLLLQANSGHYELFTHA